MRTHPESRVSADLARAGSDVAEFAADVHYYLRQDPRQLPSKYLYDALGSALFEAICHLPWYRITRAERQLLVSHAPEIFELAAEPAVVVELGPGSGEKLRTLLENARSPRPEIEIHLVDVSKDALDTAIERLGSLPSVSVTGHTASYDAGLVSAMSRVRSDRRALVLFLGSNIGNFDPPAAAALLQNVRRSVHDGDALLLGADLVKPERELLLAYDDPLGVTAAFNRNLLVRINRELAADFDVTQFDHEAVWNAEPSRVEMHLVSRCAQHVRIAAARTEFRLEAGERIWTESSYKYSGEGVWQMLESAGFVVLQQWIDAQAGFALTLARASSLP